MNTPFDVNLNLVPWKHTGNKAIISLIEKILSDNNIARYKIYPPKDDARAFQFEVEEDANKAKELLNQFYCDFSIFINQSNLK